MKLTTCLMVLALGWAFTVQAEPNEACREFIEKNCQGEHPGKCLRDNREKLPEACKKDFGDRGGKHPGGGHPPFLEKCKDASVKCEGKGRGPEQMKCLEENGSAECKAEIQKAKARFKQRPGF